MATSRPLTTGPGQVHGTLSCYFTKNDECNWPHMRYHWPPMERDAGKIRVNLRSGS
jgi:hypothetical protein